MSELKSFNQSAVDRQITNQENFIGKIPSWVVVGITGSIFGIIILITAGLLFLSFPTKTSVQVSFHTKEPISYINIDPNINLDSVWVRNGQVIRKGDIIAVYSSNINPTALLILKQWTTTYLSDAEPKSLPEMSSENLGTLFPTFAELRAMSIQGKNTFKSQHFASKVKTLYQSIIATEDEIFIKSPASGKIQMSALQGNLPRTIAVLPKDTTLVGEIRVPLRLSDKLPIGTMINISLGEFPAEEFGNVVGRIKGVSRNTSQLDTLQTLEISFDKPLKTDLGTVIPNKLSYEGSAEITLKKSKLLSQLLNSLSL